MPENDTYQRLINLLDSTATRFLSSAKNQNTTLGEALETTSQQMIAWARNPRSASCWRTKAGLPSP